MRTLNPIEEAYTIINDFYPLTATCVLRIKNGPGENILKSALYKLQLTHPLLNVVIKEKNGQYWFDKNKEPGEIPLYTIARKNDNHWEDIVRQELNIGFTSEDSSLVRVNYLVSKSVSNDAEIILSFHHAIIDAEVLLLIANQLLFMSAESELELYKFPEFSSNQIAPDFVKVLPDSFRGLRLFNRLFTFIIRQLKDEVQYKKTIKKVPDRVIPSSSENDIITLFFSREETSTLVKWSRKKRISLNAIISAAMLIIVNKFNYREEKELMRAIQFGNLRQYLQPSASSNYDGCFAAMLRFTVPLLPGMNILEIATYMDKQSLKSARRGDKFIFALLGKFLIKKTIKAHNARLSATALSYVGPLQFRQQYGDIVLTDIHGFITNNCLGAELTGFGKILFERLSIDLNFLTEETSRDKATEMAKGIKSLILKSVNDL